MSIYNYEEAFGAADKTTPAMKKAIERWFALYYDDSTDESKDPGQRIAYTVVNKLVRTVFGEYKVTATTALEQLVVQALNTQKLYAMQLALVGGAVFTLLTFLYSSVQERLSSGPNAKAAPVLSALGLYLAFQVFANIIL